MLSKMLMRAAPLLARQSTPVFLMGSQQVRTFRSDYQNPYIYNPTPLTETERVKQEELPVWERVFDFKKYMHHEGPLKVEIN
jgi:hypothetical protein